MDLLRSKKFQAALVGLVVVIGKHFIPELDEMAAVVILLPILVYILGQGIADVGKEREHVKNALIWSQMDTDKKK